MRPRRGWRQRGMISPSGINTKARVCARGWGTTRGAKTGAEQVRMVAAGMVAAGMIIRPKSMMSMSSGLGPQRRPGLRPASRSIDLAKRSNRLGLMVVLATTTALKKGGCHPPPTGFVLNCREVATTWSPSTRKRSTACHSASEGEPKHPLWLPPRDNIANTGMLCHPVKHGRRQAGTNCVSATFAVKVRSIKDVSQK